MKTAVYPGSFNPFHKGHADVVTQALKTFDRVIIARGVNGEKGIGDNFSKEHIRDFFTADVCKRIRITSFSGFLVDYIDRQKPDAVVKGLRNIQDFEYEKSQLYWNEDLGIDIPTFFIIADRANCHISSSTIKLVAKIKSRG